VRRNKHPNEAQANLAVVQEMKAAAVAEDKLIFPVYSRKHCQFRQCFFI
jgi:thioredoxin-related protein